MGAYLSAPSIEKKSDDFSDSEKFSYGVSRMQGWRISMEDAHNCVPYLNDTTSLFGVFDGHGGSEVALYCALHFSDVLKNLENYKGEKYKDALREAFMKIDKVLLEDRTIRELKILADRDPDSGAPTEEEMKAVETRQQDEEECEEDEMELLHEEATISIEELLARYGKAANETKSQIKEQKEKFENEDVSKEDVGSSSSISEDSKVKKEEGSSSVADEGVSSSADSTSEATSSGAGGSSNPGEPSSTSDVKAENSVSSSIAKSDDVTSSSEVSSTSETKEEAGCESQLTTKTSISDEEAVSSSSSSNSATKSKTDNATSSKDDALGGGEPASSVTKSHSKSSGVKVESSGKIRPKVKAVKLGPSDEDFDPGSGSDPEEESEEGFDSDEAVEGSSESGEEEEEEDDDEEEEEDMDMVKIPSLGAIAAASEEPGKDSGTTAVVALLNNYDLYVANAGDSRCVLCRNGTAVDMSDDHKPEDESEIKRIKAAGGHVNMQGRVNGGLNLSRAIGDHCYKTNSSLELENQMISAMPDIRKVTLSSSDSFMVLACDGIWNVLSSQDVVNFVLARLPQHGSDGGMKLSSICEELMDTCLAPDTTGDGTGCDNMTCVIVKFNEEWLKNSTPNTSIEDTKAGKVEESELKTNSDLDGVTDAKINGDVANDAKNSSVKRPRTENVVELESTSKRQKVEA